MFIEVVHANGLYNLETGFHRSLDGAGLGGSIGQVVGRAILGGATVLYTPNLGANAGQVIGDPEAEARALRYDPFYLSLATSAQQALHIRFDGAQGLPPGYSNETVEMENDIVRREKEGFVIGKYTSACVLVTAQGMKSRHPTASVMVDRRLCSEWPGEDILNHRLHGVELKDLRGYLGYQR